MNFFKVDLLLLVFFIFTNLILCVDHDNEDEHEHHDGESEYDHDEENHRPRHESHYFDQDPHEEDPDYDEDILTGTSHHHKRDTEQIKKDIEELFKKMDKNNDGKIEKDELTSHITQSIKQLHNESTIEEFEKVDTNMDKKVTMDEFSIFEHHDPLSIMENITSADNSTAALDIKKRIQQEKARFKLADKDGDGFLNEHEYLLFKYPVYFPHMAHTVVHDYIEDLDTNNDGVVDKKEYVDHFHIADGKDKESNEKNMKKAEEDFVKYDKDKNGKIDSEEYFAILKPGYEEPAKSETDYLIKETDANNDGILTLEEIENQSHKWLGGDSQEHVGQDEEYYGQHLEDEL